MAPNRVSIPCLLSGYSEGMTARRLKRFILLLCHLVCFLAALPVPAQHQAEQHGVAATGHPLATYAAIDVLKRGGNAIDGAVAAALTLGVVDGHNSGIGGGCFMVLHLADGTALAIEGREKAPAAATRDMFTKEGKADTDLSQTGALAIGVPGSVAVYDYALRKFGKLSFSNHLESAARIAEQGFPITRTYAQRLASTASDLRKFDAARAIFLNASGHPHNAGELLRQPDLAQTYRTIARAGANWFYRGPFADMTERWMAANKGVIRAKDFHDYQLILREPLRSTYRGHEIIGFPPPSSGGVHVAQILNILEHLDLKKMGAGSADFIHVTTEAMKLAFADRAFWLGDPDFVPVPRGLASKDYAAKLARKIALVRTTAIPGHNIPERATEDLFRKHTTHFSVADSEGNWVACTATVNTTFGSKVVIPGTGVIMNNQMDDFSIQPGTPNAFGLIGAEANSVAPGKRPLSSMSPTIVLKDGKPLLSVGAAGGPTIISQTLLAIINVIDFEMPVERALAAPRFHHQWKPDELRIEKTVPEAVRAELKARGHTLRVVDELGATQAVAASTSAKKFSGAADPRGEGEATAF